MYRMLGILLGLVLLGTAWAKCDNPFYPVREGWVWTYKSSLDGKTHTNTLSNVSDSGFTNTIQFDKGSVESRWRCDSNGLSSLEYGATNFSGKHNQFNLKTVDSKGVMIPTNLSIGSTWTYSFTLEGDMSTGKINSNVETSSKVVGEETVSVPAGTFKAFKVESTSVMKMSMNINGKTQDLPSNTIKSTSWYAPGVGLVKSLSNDITTELVSLKK
ncbi:MAG: hypothetical protein IVW51_00410 [Thermaceae bacterium]|nr:hypothetical protein [Thermaceae bacterium]